MKRFAIIFTLFFLAFFTIGCSHAIRVSPNGETNLQYNSKALNVKEETVGIKAPKITDAHLMPLYNNFVLAFSNTYKGKVIKDYDPTGRTKVDKVLEISIKDIEYDYNHLKSFFIQFPGFIIFMPAWNGLSYKIDVISSYSIYDSKNSLIKTTDVKDSFIMNYTDFGRGVVSELGGWLFWSVPSLIGAFVPSKWDDEMKITANMFVGDRYFGRVLTSRIIKDLNELNKDYINRGIQY